MSAPPADPGAALSHRRVLAIALPIVLSNATIPLLGAVDTGVVGQMGEAAPIGAVGVGAIILATIYWVFGFLRMGTSGLVAQSRGAGDAVESGAHLLRALGIGLAAGAALILLLGGGALTLAATRGRGLPQMRADVPSWRLTPNGFEAEVDATGLEPDLHWLGLRLTGRDDEQVALVETYAKEAGLWSDTLAKAEFERVLTFDLSSVVRNMAGPSNPHRRLPTSALNRWFEQAVDANPPPAVSGRRLKLNYITQTKARPPTFVMMASRASAMPDHYKRYLVNSIRESFDLPGTPIRLNVKSSGVNPYAEGGAKSGPERYKGDAKTAPRRVKKAEKEEALSKLPGKALEQKKARVAKPRVIGAVKASSSKKAGTSVAIGKGARGGARQVSRSGRVRTGQKGGAKR